VSFSKDNPPPLENTVVSVRPDVSTANQVGTQTRFSFWQRLGRGTFPYLLILPTLVMILAFTIWPTINAGIQSTIKQPILARYQPEFVGLQNYFDLFDENTVIGQSDNFPRIFVNTIVFVAVTVPVSVGLGFLLALLLNQKLRGISLFRTAIFYPVMLPFLGAASIWAYLYADNIGFINIILHDLGLERIGWTRDANLVLVSLMLVAIWKQTGFYMIFYLAGLQNLPQDIYEAAQLDGARAWQRVLRLTVPLLNGTTLFVIIVAGTNAFQTADPLYALGQGQPNNRSNLILYEIFRRYTEPHDQGYVYAMTMVLLAMLLIFTLANFLIVERRTHYE
jgi:sn-glycerol 3-phosphate transport system permease protein